MHKNFTFLMHTSYVDPLTQLPSYRKGLECSSVELKQKIGSSRISAIGFLGIGDGGALMAK